MPVSIEKIHGRAILPFAFAERFLQEEFSLRLKIHSAQKKFGELLYIEDFPNFEKNIYFARTQMLEPFLINFDSIGQAAETLKSVQRNWASYQFQFFRRAHLIQKKLPYVNLKKREFPAKIPQSPIGLYTLLSERTILASAKTQSPLPAGKIEFKEDHENPPSRAYLKLWEALAMHNYFFGTPFPNAGARCFDAGAAPGGWTWALCALGANVFAVDRAPLDERLMKNPLVDFFARDAFTLQPRQVGQCDWVLSDVICYPNRLYEWALKWSESGLCKNMICTIKMQGKTDFDAAERFEKIPNSKVIHLNSNKHELTWLWHEK